MKSPANSKSEGEDPEPSSKQVMAELIEMDNEVEIIDSTFLLEPDTFSIMLTHHSLHDSLVVAPVQYLRPYGLKEFMTHSFISDIIAKRKDTIIVNKVVSKGDFVKVEEDYLVKHGILMSPYISKADNEKKQLTARYSLSIPLTDVGQNVLVLINKDGRSNSRPMSQIDPQNKMSVHSHTLEKWTDRQ